VRRTALVVVLVLAALGASAHAEDRSPAIYPPQRLPITFDHGQHLRAGADCLTCHDRARKSQKAADWNLPAHPECEACHDLKAAARGRKTDPPSACSTCHPGFDPTVMREPHRLQAPAANLRFDHQVHASRKIDCRTCHGPMEQVALATVAQLPKMRTCLQCHDGQAAPSRCTTCHLAAPSGGRLLTSFPSGDLLPMPRNPFGVDHGPRFEFTHGARATAARATCAQCHAEADCQSCHDGIRKPLSVHPNDFISLHPVQARQNVLRCESCHRMQSFCATCHERTGLSKEADPALLRGGGQGPVHPNLAEWVGLLPDNRVVVGPRHHGIQAARDLRTCISCHREETCVQCHSSTSTGRLGGRRVVPHPPGFRDLCKRAAALNDRPCLICHREDDASMQACR
jgi:hypothetical protein